MSKGMEGGVSRRSFLKGAGVAAAAVAGSAALAGCASGSTGAASGDWLPKSWDYECDLLVIGYGGAGMWASLIGADECGQEVIVLEKAPVEGGGNSRINNGEWTIVEESDKERFKKYIKAFTHGKTPEPMIDAWVNECVRNTEYADKYGMTYEVSEVALAGAIPEYYFLDDNAYEGSCKLSSVDGFGMLSFRELDAQREKLGVQVLFDCHDERLIQNPETKEIVGAYTMIGSEEKTVKARKGVIMTTGGFEFNEDLKNAYLKCYPFKFEGWQFNTGDGIKMVQNVGAQLWHMNNIIGSYNAYFKDFEWPYAFTVTPGANNYVMLDRLGKRWIAESTFLSPHVGWHEFEKFNDSTLADFERIPTWVIAGQEVIDAGPLGAVKGGVLNTPGGSTAIGMALEDIPSECGGFEGWSVDNQTEIEKGWIIKADTLEELCTKMAAVDNAPDAASVQATLETYNAYCDEGNDPAFDRTADTLAPVSLDGPFYAWPLYPGGCSTLGGPKKNTEANVVDCNDQPIPRLYAAGCFGNMAGHTYGISGGNNAENMVWGRIAGRNAASLEAWDAQAK